MVVVVVAEYPSFDMITTLDHIVQKKRYNSEDKVIVNHFTNRVLNSILSYQLK